jgi:hypothetical protein
MDTRKILLTDSQRATVEAIASLRQRHAEQVERMNRAMDETLTILGMHVGLKDEGMGYELWQDAKKPEEIYLIVRAPKPEPEPQPGVEAQPEAVPPVPAPEKPARKK